jgi:hypothetical protein
VVESLSAEVVERPVVVDDAVAVLVEGSRDEVVLAGVSTLPAVVGAERNEFGGDDDDMLRECLVKPKQYC